MRLLPDPRLSFSGGVSIDAISIFVQRWTTQRNAGMPDTVNLDGRGLNGKGYNRKSHLV